MTQQFEHCSRAELDIFSKIANGSRADRFDPKIVQRLIDLNLLITDNRMTTVPVLVWNEWQKYLATSKKFKKERPPISSFRKT